MNKKPFFLIILAILALAITACQTKTARGISPDEQIVDNILSGKDDHAPIAYVNGTAVERGPFLTLYATMRDAQQIDSAQAYQDALNLIVQNTLLEQESVRRGYEPGFQEVKQRTREYIDESKENPAIEILLLKEAAQFGVSMDSEAFVVHYAPTIKSMMLAEILNQHLLAEANGDLNQFELKRQNLVADLLSKARIEIIYENLPPEAANVSIPKAEELPIIQNPKPIPEE